MLRRLAAGSFVIPRPAMIKALRNPRCYPHPVTTIRVVETHISWVILTGDIAYKIKKPVNLGFLDFTSLDRRRHYCEEELRLNRRLAAELYLEVVTIRGTAETATIGGEGPVLDYAVKMREFPQESLASRALARRAFDASHVDALATVIAEFHARAPLARAHESFGTPKAVLAAALQNFEQMLPVAKAAPDDRALRALRQWTEREFALRRGAFKARKRQGFVRECHGDLHLGNIVVLDGRPVPFDCIEFNDDLRWIDVMSEAGFLFMDLFDRKRPDLAWRFLNRYLEETGDYDGLAVLRFYVVYRALVRAKVHLVRSQQPRLAPSEKSRLKRAFHGYIRLARQFARAGAPALLISHGPSGSGKTTGTQYLIEQLGTVRLRSDVERKRMHGVAPLARTGAAPGAGIYTEERTAATYRRLSELADAVLAAGYSAVVDASFLSRAERDRFRALAGGNGIPFRILDFQAPETVLRERLARRARQQDASEADAAILERQLGSRERLGPDERRFTIPIPDDRARPRRSWRRVLKRLRRVTTR